VGAAALVAQKGGAVTTTGATPVVSPPAAPAPSTPTPGQAAPMRALTLAEARELKTKVIELLKTVFDPEIPVNIYELGMVYNTSVDLAGAVDVSMTLTSPACPVAGSLPGEVQNKVASIAGVSSARVNLVWTPMWTKDMMSDAAKLKLNLM